MTSKDRKRGGEATLRERLRDHPGWDGLALCVALILPIIGILLFTPRFGVLAIPEALVFAGMASWLCSGHRALG